MLELDLDVATRLSTVIARSDRLLARQAAGDGLPRTQYSVLAAVVRRGPLRLADLVDRERLHPTMLSRIVGALEREGLLRRVPDPQDGRAVVLEATTDGGERFRALHLERTRRIDDYLDGLSDLELRHLQQALPVLEGLAEHLLAEDAAPAGSRAAAPPGATRAAPSPTAATPPAWRP